MKLIHKVILFGLGVYVSKKTYDWWFGYKKPSYTDVDIQELTKDYWATPTEGCREIHDDTKVRVWDVNTDIEACEDVDESLSETSDGWTAPKTSVDWSEAKTTLNDLKEKAPYKIENFGEQPFN